LPSAPCVVLPTGDAHEVIFGCPVVEAEYLFIQMAEHVEGLTATLQQAPEVLQPGAASLVLFKGAGFDFSFFNVAQPQDEPGSFPLVPVSKLVPYKC
jgi:hypothetical protein